MNTKLSYEYRADGQFLIQRFCASCGEGYDVHALSNAIGATNLCAACEQVEKWVNPKVTPMNDSEQHVSRLDLLIWGVLLLLLAAAGAYCIGWVR